MTMKNNDTQREEGFYWIKVDPFPEEIAKWDGHFNWWTAGADQPIQIGEVQVLSERISPPPSKGNRNV
jgi:hypothetical protein